MKNIIFIGMPGAGKTTIGKEVARTLAWPFFDSDVRLRERIHRDIKELFRESEAAFRQEETETLRELCQKEGIVLSCGGGVIKKAENVALLKHGGFLIFLDRSLEAIASSVDQMGRPLLSASKIASKSFMMNAMPCILPRQISIFPFGAASKKRWRLFLLP